jgi:3-isopropylmalate/(R)-2-methylmalate dehydratase large subunit
MSSKTLFEKIWETHVVAAETDSDAGDLYVDLHLVHEVTSPQAFSELRERGLKLRRPDRMLATLDHSTPTLPANAANGERPYANDEAEGAGRAAGNQLPRIRHRAAWLGQRAPRHRACDRPGAGRDAAGHDHRLRRQPHGHPWRLRRAGVRHRHHRSRPRAGHAMPAAAQAEVARDPCRRQAATGGVGAKDLILHIIGSIGVDGGTGHVIEYRGAAIEALSMEERMTVCNMSIEAGARAGLIAPDETTFAWLKGRPHAPRVPHGTGCHALARVAHR